MITRLFTEINEKMEEVEKILKDNNYFVDLEKKMKEYNDRMMAIHDNEATKYINIINKAIEYIEQEVNNCDIYCDGCTPQHCPDIKKILDILKGSDKE